MTNVGEDVEKREPLYTLGGNVNWCSHCGKQWFLKKLKIELLYDPSIPFLSIYLKKDTYTPIQKDTYTPMFIAALFTIAKLWKQPKCPSTDEWIKKMWYVCVYIYIYEFYSAIKKNEILPLVTTWMNLEGIMLNEISQTEKGKYCMISLICKI